MQSTESRSARSRVHVARRAIRVRGTVQGVGLRPTVYRIARAAGLTGFVRNDAEGVWIEIEGDLDAVVRFADALRRDAPPLARITSIEIVDKPPIGDTSFVVVSSTSADDVAAIVPADAATCDACLAELFDPNDRRYRYPFVNCTDCGPRYTIVRDVPYDRARTTMDAFDMCAECRAEYEDPAHRRFHAEPNACPACGPRVALVEKGASTAAGDSAVVRACRLLAAGAIVAVKGLGGYQLAVDATNETAVKRLRARKRRPHKPFAVMACDVAAVARLASVSEVARTALVSPARPIVLLPKLPRAAVAASVAPALDELGVMLPATPLHHLLLAGVPFPLVMTSGNSSEEPIAKDDDEAFKKLEPIADSFLVHDRVVHTRADDSVVRVIAGEARVMRRARGYVPDPVAMGFDGPPVLAVGAQLKSCICVARGGEAHLSQHIGDLDGLEARAFFTEVVAKLEALLGVSPAIVAHDLHPDYASTRWALASGRSCMAVQHHHAHVASCLAEHGRTSRVIGVAFDGTGCGPAGELWGGELFACDLGGFERLGHLRPIALPGGESAIREPWRLALAALVDADESLDVLDSIPEPRRVLVRRVLDLRACTPRATGAGRWFDAVAALLGVRERITYEAQAAIELEALARQSDDDTPYPFAVETPHGGPFQIDLRPAVRAIADDVRRRESRTRVASRFHATMADAIRHACRIIRRRCTIDTVALSGGCFQSVLLTERTKARLEADDFEVLVHARVPPNDGGIALGQAAVAAYRAQHGTTKAEG
jgi:hydrogenase maturation protein HypF